MFNNNSNLVLRKRTGGNPVRIATRNLGRNLGVKNRGEVLVPKNNNSNNSNSNSICLPVNLAIAILIITIIGVEANRKESRILYNSFSLLVLE